ncbi:hypothetical protein [Sinomicrobium weinanense]|uniref:Uncharacterized protein n=1 Tax=Sinomicrobium weinanense TaxID=2842200 RepID=A0A926JNX9_9FLAO|nr:hypothetical protein [Sinomicrobium weinanense]MBC9794628.1 hypothetical protein [Sinomicrobium weinanense]MBU3124113.1 hypothetical protein [Sinomicrobium weinanense]
MDLISLEMGVVFLLIFMAPVIYILTKESRKKKKLNADIDKICADNHIKNTGKEYIGHQVFVLDPNGKKLLNYHRKQGNFSVVDLKEYDSCSLQRSGERNEHYKNILRSISISFNKKEQGKPLYITVFDDSYENPLEAEAILHETERFVRLLNTQA